MLEAQKGLYKSKLYWILFLFYLPQLPDTFQFLLLLLCFIGISIGIASSAIGLKICSTTAGIKKYESKQLRKKEGTW